MGLALPSIRHAAGPARLSVLRWAWGALSFPSRVAIVALVAILALPWAVRGYARYWDLAIGQPCHLVETMAPQASR